MSRRKRVFIKIGTGILLFLVFALLFVFAQRLVQAKWTKGHLPTSSWHEYESLEKDTVDVLFMGTSQVYSAVDPMLLYQETGITGYVISEGGMCFDLDYAALQAAVKTQSPKLLFLDASAIRSASSKTEGKVRPMLDQLPISLSKVQYLLDCDVEEITLLNGLFPFFRYHSRWDELDQTDLSYALGNFPDTFVRGHYISYKTVEASWKFYGGDPAVSFEIPERPRTYLEKIADFCEENGIELIFYKLPTVAWRKAYSDASKELADELGISYWEMFYENDAIGVDDKTDFRDSEKHINQYGAEKITHYIGSYLQENYELEDQRGSNQRWDEDLVKYKKLLKKKQ